MNPHRLHSENSRWRAFLCLERKKDIAKASSASIFYLRCKKDFAAFSLVEITLALGLMAFCLVSMIGLLPVGLRQERTSSEQLAALQLLSAIASDFRTPDLSPGAITTRYKVELPATGSSRKTGAFFADEHFEKTDTASGGAFQVFYEITPPTSQYGSYKMHLFVSWSNQAVASYNRDSLKGKDFVESVISREI